MCSYNRRVLSYLHISSSHDSNESVVYSTRCYMILLYICTTAAAAAIYVCSRTAGASPYYMMVHYIYMFVVLICGVGLDICQYPCSYVSSVNHEIALV